MTVEQHRNCLMLQMILLKVQNLSLLEADLKQAHYITASAPVHEEQPNLAVIKWKNHPLPERHRGIISRLFCFKSVVK